MMTEHVEPSSKVQTSMPDCVHSIEVSLHKALSEARVTEDCANLIGALFAHQNGLVLNLSRKLEKVREVEAERNLDMQAL
jgi:hypothetical protein